MTQALKIRLTWEGTETINAIEAALGQPCSIELTLAANYHHALFRQFHSDAPPGQLEILDEKGGGELLSRFAAIEGLQALADLSGKVSAANGTVTVTRPALVTIEIPCRQHARQRAGLPALSVKF